MRISFSEMNTSLVTLDEIILKIKIQKIFKYSELFVRRKFSPAQIPEISHKIHKLYALVYHSSKFHDPIETSFQGDCFDF